MKLWLTFPAMMMWYAIGSAASYSTQPVPLSEMPMPPVNARFPVTYDAISIVNAYAAPNSADGESAAIEGEVISVQKLKNGLPTITLRLTPELTIVVLHSTPLEKSGFLQLGTRLRSMGYLRKTQDMVTLLGAEAKNINPLSLQSICIVQPQTFAGAFDQKYINLCAAWQRGLKLERLD